ELVRVSQLGRLDDLRHSESRVAAADVVGHRIVEDKAVLKDQPDLRPQRVECHPFQITAVDAHLTAGRVEETRQQVDEGELLVLIGTDNADLLSGSYSDIDPFEQHPAARGLAQQHVAELEFFREPGEELRVNQLSDLRLPIEKLEDPRRRLPPAT